MRKNVSKVIEAILINEYHRASGTATIGGVERSWTDAYQLSVLMFGDTKAQLRKYRVSSTCEKEIENKLKDVSWGAHLSIVLDDDGREVIDVNIICDPYSNIDIL